MCNASRFERHARLVARMGDALGVDLETRVQSGELPPEVLDDHVFECLGCPKPDACERWLDAQVGPVKAAPDYCRNKIALEAMAERR